MTETATEEKIKEAARIVFMERGYAAAGMRDIAAKAGVNLSLVNYYFRSKKNIFQIIMLEKMHKIFGNIIPYMIDENTDWLLCIHRAVPPHGCRRGPGSDGAQRP